MTRAGGTPTGVVSAMCEWWKDERTQCTWPAEVEIPCEGFDAPHRVCPIHERRAREHCQWKVTGKHQENA